ncbi:hypothetical protein AKG11_24605 [Shinella sp. SUS2]|nr:hypothetical protein AKG11_24605 [Shinella sp. SUS2]KOC73180.1 hypothetical protein AKG10_23775 [Shinella sp. GWS1]
MLLTHQRQCVGAFAEPHFRIIAEFIEDEDSGELIEFGKAFQAAIDKVAILAIATREAIAGGKLFEVEPPTGAFLIVADINAPALLLTDGRVR